MAECVLGVELQTNMGQDVSPLNFEDMYEVMEVLCKFEPEDIVTLQMQSPDPKRVDINTVNEDVWYKRYLHRLLEKKFSLLL